jgi:hypothetical protein
VEYDFEILKLSIMKNTFNQGDIDEIIARIGQLSSESTALWGKMNVAQMLAHCTTALEMASGKINPPRVFIGRILGPLFKSIYYNDKSFGKDSPTDKLLVVADERNFILEKDKLLQIIADFHKGGEEQCTSHPHSFFGEFTPAQWGVGMYKHLDHHLRQFGV